MKKTVEHKNKSKIDAEMLVHVAMCTHENPQKIAVVASDESCKKICEQLDKYSYGSLEFIANSDELAKQNGIYDIVVIVDPKASYTSQFAQNIAASLDKKGVAVMLDETDKSSIDDYKQRLANLKNSFFVVKPYGMGEYLFVSNKFHPTADIILDRADMLEDTLAYNADWHIASFAIPSYFKKALKNIIEY